jgi:hypothetical protein
MSVCGVYIRMPRLLWELHRLIYQGEARIKSFHFN